jgi:outer membrane protein TolC
MLAENLSTYRKVVSLFKKRPLLSPEQETSLLVFQLAMDEGLLKKTSLKNEERLLKTEIYQWVGYDLSLPRSLLPRTPQSWPNLLVESSPSIDQWSRVKTAEAKLRSAQAITQVVHSEGWPTLKIGPSVETESPLTGTRTAVGFALSTSLPFYQRNEGKKAEAIQGEKLAELKLKIIKKGGELEREKLVSDYQHNLKAYLAAKPQLIREQKHQEIESLFERGLIPSSLMLETHRQMFEFQQELHQAELKAIESLWKIYALEGRLLEESL